MIVSIITVGSTIRLSVFARRREIEIMKYVGATNALVTLPFVVEGLAMGLISGALTAGVSLAAYSYTVSAASTLGGLWQMIMGHALAGNQNHVAILRRADALHNGRTAIKFHTHRVFAFDRHPCSNRLRNARRFFRSRIVARDHTSVGKP